MVAGDFTQGMDWQGLDVCSIHPTHTTGIHTLSDAIIDSRIGILLSTGPSRRSAVSAPHSGPEGAAWSGWAAPSGLIQPLGLFPGRSPSLTRFAPSGLVLGPAAWRARSGELMLSQFGTGPLRGTSSGLVVSVFWVGRNGARAPRTLRRLPHLYQVPDLLVGGCVHELLVLELLDRHKATLLRLVVE